MSDLEKIKPGLAFTGSYSEDALVSEPGKHLLSFRTTKGGGEPSVRFSQLLLSIILACWALASKANVRDTIGNDLTIINKSSYKSSNFPAFPQPGQHVLYIGQENKILMASDKYDSKDILVSTSSGNITRISSDEFIIRLGVESDSNTIGFYISKGNKKKLIKEIVFASRKITDSVLGMVDKTLIKNLPVTKLNTITVRELLDIKSPVDIITFKILVSIGPTKLFHYPNVGNRLSAATVDRFAKLLPGEGITIDGIWILENGVKRRIRDVFCRLIE